MGQPPLYEFECPQCGERTSSLDQSATVGHACPAVVKKDDWVRFVPVKKKSS